MNPTLGFVIKGRALSRMISALLLSNSLFLFSIWRVILQRTVVFLIAVGFLDSEGDDLITELGEGTNVVAGYGADDLIIAQKGKLFFRHRT